ncbi:MAG TPA: hypothetical protein VGK94_12870 [Candidatus Polarisedimenticolia bacterium]|jgi:hypothetical protein
MPRTSSWLPVIALATVLLWGVLWWPYTVDDSYITYRYAQNTALGQGAVFNAGERVEGYSSPAWMFLLAGAAWIGANPVLVSKLLGLGAALALVALLPAALRRAGCDPTLAGLAALVLATTPTLHVYSVSGMETVWFALAVAIAALMPAVAGSERARAWLAGAGLIGLTLMRPEGGLAAVVLTLCWLALYRTRALRVAVALAWLVIAGHLAWRTGYYGAIVPNTFVAKPSPIIREFAVGHPGFAAFKLFRSVEDNLMPALNESGGTAAVLLALAALALAGSVPGVWPAALVAVAGFTFVVYARSDWMLGSRFGFPFFAPLLFLAAVGADAVRQRLDRPHPGAAGRAATLTAFAAVSLWCVWSTVQTAEYLSRHGEGTVNTAMDAEVYERIGRWLHDKARPGDRLLAYEVGAVAYASGMHIIDQHGLVTPQVAKIVQWAEGDFREIRIGKDRETMQRIVQWCADQKPEWFLVRAVRALELTVGEPLPAGAAMDAMQNALLERFGDTMVFAEAFAMRPDSRGWKDDRYLVLKKREAPAP